MVLPNGFFPLNFFISDFSFEKSRGFRLDWSRPLTEPVIIDRKRTSCTLISHYDTTVNFQFAFRMRRVAFKNRNCITHVFQCGRGKPLFQLWWICHFPDALVQIVTPKSIPFRANRKQLLRCRSEFHHRNARRNRMEMSKQTTSHSNADTNIRIAPPFGSRKRTLGQPENFLLLVAIAT